MAELRMNRGETIGGYELVREQASLAGAGAPSQPFTVGLYPVGGSLGPITVTARGLLAGVEVVTRTARTSFVKGESRILRLDLRRACRAVSCTAAETCSDGVCVSAEVPVSALPPWTGTLPSADAGPPGMDAGRDAGPSGVDGSIDAGPPMDAQLPDGGAADAGPDDGGAGDAALGDAAGTPDAGSSDSGPSDSGVACDPRYTLLPLAGRVEYSGSLDATSPLLHRPDDSVCPAVTSVDDFPYEARTFCNPGPARTIDVYLFGRDSDPTYTHGDPWLVVYDGDAIPADPGACLESNDDFGTTSSRILMPIGAGQVVTIVATSFCPSNMTTSCSAPTDAFGTQLLRIDVR